MYSTELQLNFDNDMPGRKSDRRVLLEKAPDYYRENPEHPMETYVELEADLVGGPSGRLPLWTGRLPSIHLDYESVKNCQSSEKNFEVLLSQIPAVELLETLLKGKSVFAVDEHSDHFQWIEGSYLQVSEASAMSRYLTIPCDRNQLEKLLLDLKMYIRGLLRSVSGVTV